jgi:hypothetical protein
MMNTKALVVGQDVYLKAGVYSLKGKVVKVTWLGVTVQIYSELDGRIPSRLLRFDSEGKQRGEDSMFEGGPWYIDDAS